MNSKTLESFFPKYSPVILKSIHYLEKKEYDTYYSTYYKYPLLVHEIIDELSGKPAIGTEKIDRSEIVDPYSKDSNILSKDQYTLEEYKILMKYGLSPGHNTPAGNHMTDRNIWDESFLMTNMTPQEMTFNSGMWVLVEAWSRNLGTNKKIMNIHCFTGCIPDDEEITTAENININIPTHWYKIITALDRENPKILYTLVIIIRNDKMFVKKMETYPLDKFTVPIHKLEDMCNINFMKIMEWYNIYNSQFHKLSSLKTIMPIIFKAPYSLQIQMEKCNWFGRIIYSETIAELEKTWKDIQPMETRFRDLQYHKEYYDHIKKRLIEELANN